MSLGAESPTEIPAAATQWMNNFDGASMYGPGAHVIQRFEPAYSQGSGDPFGYDGIIMQKWAETIEDWPKLNAARPCGYDRWVIDELTVACIDSFDSETGALVLNSYFDPNSFALNDIVALAGGVYQVQVASHPNYTLGDGTTAGVVKYVPPSNITYENVAKLKNPTARGICGALVVSSATQAAEDDPVIITTARQHWLRVGDTVNFTSITGLSTGHAVTVIDDTSFSVPFTGEFTPYSSGGTVAQTGGDAALDTTCSEGKYYTREWTTQLRLAAEDPEEPAYTLTETEHDYTFAGGQKSYVVCISPNEGDVFPSGVRYDFEDVEADMCYGNNWHKDVVQAVTDPNWQAKHEACDGTDYTMAAQYCTVGATEYARPPLVEPSAATGASVPSVVGVAYCESEPRSSATVHNVRASWLTCNDWKVPAGANCGTKGY
jgi:hypothetical protein